MKKIVFLLAGICITYMSPAKNINGAVFGISSLGQKMPLAYATVHWLGSSQAIFADENGRFDIPLPATLPALLIASFVGYASDSTTIATDAAIVEFMLYEGAQLDEVFVTGRQAGIYTPRLTLMKTEVIGEAGLKKMACCNIGESFENSAGISVGYSDAVSGARQIRLLGLSGVYTQMLDENRTDMRGLAMPFGLSFTPGQWLESIQVAKGTGSVLQGYESITGQINLEYRKPTADEPLLLNLYTDQFLRTELNVASSMKLTDRLSTVMLTHASIDPLKMDENRDGFLDEPLKKQLNIANRWLYTASNGMVWHFGAKGLYEARDGGQVNFDKRRPRNDASYGTGIENTHLNAYVKLGIPLYSENGHDNESNIAFIADYTYHDINSFFGLKQFDGNEHTLSFNAMLQSGATEKHRYTLGIGGRRNIVGQRLVDVWFLNYARNDADVNLNSDELVSGIFGEYTFSHHDKLTLVAGLRADYHSVYQWLVTPRMTFKYNFTDNFILRASGGRGFRTAYAVTDNIGMMASGRQIVIDKPLNMEDAWTFGGSVSWYFGLLNDHNASFSVDYFHTRFNGQVVADMESNPLLMQVYNLNGHSFSNTVQMDLNVEPIERLSMMVTFRYTDARMAYHHSNLRERPLNDRFKGVFNVQYATLKDLWTFDFTAQLNGSMRLPDFAVVDGRNYSPVFPLFFAQVTRKFKHLEIYAGCENITNYKQTDPIIYADEPYDVSFNSSVLWAPITGRKIYAGLRFTFTR